MNTKTSMQERISAFADGELADSEIELVLKDLQTPAGRAAWDEYHRIGDLARSEDMNVPLSASFSARMAARLEAEPTILAPAAAAQNQQKRQTQTRRYAAPALGAAAMAALAFLVTPQVLKSMKGETGQSAPAVVAASGQSPALSEHAAVIAAATPAVHKPGLRDVDTYVLAHQRVSPSLSSSEHSAIEAAPRGEAK
jgi:sigma-E factor negative regulatory protein RseA